MIQNPYLLGDLVHEKRKELFDASAPVQIPRTNVIRQRAGVTLIQIGQKLMGGDCTADRQGSTVSTVRQYS
jgi:hypothetical protein